MPRPLPVVGADVIVTGSYGTAFRLASAGEVLEPETGIITYRAMEYLHEPRVKARLPRPARK
jgi:hypothetical protein